MAFKNVLVPLDGSRLAEAALPAAAFLARNLNASVTLMHVIERQAPDEIHGDRHLTDPMDAQVYLGESAARAFNSDLTVECHVHTSEVGNVARSIIDHAIELRSDLVVMCSHGRSGLRGWLYGSIAQQVVAGGKRPILLVQPSQGEELSPFTCQRLLVPLDGQPEHEQGLPVAARLAQSCGASLHLLLVVHTLPTLPGARAATGRLLPRATAEMLDLTAQHAEEYLGGHSSLLQAQGIATTSEVARGDPVRNIVRVAHDAGADLIVLGTHGRHGIDAFWSGSVAPRVSSRSCLPLLIVPISTSVHSSPADFVE
jgi:nucleotide-binding universal stress UspA family protein